MHRGRCYSQIMFEGAASVTTSLAGPNAVVPVGAVLFYGEHGPMGALSNYSPTPFVFDGNLWPTAEHAYQASKFDDPVVRYRIREAPTAKEAARIGRDRGLRRRAGWSVETKLEVMRDIQVAKFAQVPAARAVLLGTGAARLVERNDRCGYWGDGEDGRGANHFGRALEVARSVCRTGLVALEQEGGLCGVTAADIIERARLIGWLRQHPDEALARLRHLEPMVGCPVGCSFCAQNASPKVVALTPRAANNLVAALKLVGLEVASRHRLANGSAYLDPAGASLVEGVFSPGFVMPEYGLIAFDRPEQRPGVVYPYLDSDPALFPHIGSFVELLYRELGIRSRISTVGISGSSPTQAAELGKLAGNTAALAGLRVSVSSYPRSAGVLRRGGTAPAFFDDLGLTLAILRPAMEKLGFGGRTACCEFRFRPHVVRSTVIDTDVGGHHVLRAGPWLLVAAQPGAAPPTSRVATSMGARLELDRPATNYLRLRDHRTAPQDVAQLVARILGGELSADLVPVHKFENIDGPYYGVEVLGTEDGERQLYLYPQTHERHGGYLDAERHLLNAIIAIKARHGKGRREGWSGATWDNVEEVVEEVERRREALSVSDPSSADYIATEIQPLVNGYAGALRTAGFQASAFFDRGFSRDTGISCNLGRAHHEYRWLASRPNLPLTAQHLRSFGHASSLAAEGTIYRLAPAREPALGLVLERRNLGATADPEGQLLSRMFLSTGGVIDLRGIVSPGERRRRSA